MFKQKLKTIPSGRHADFAFLSDDAHYLDTACQSLRPQPVIDAITTYFQEYSACGGRVKYRWGQQVDEQVDGAREDVLKFLQLSDKDYSVSFTLNTTYGINLILQQLPMGKFKRIITSDIEHNSVFLPSMTAAKRLNIDRLVLKRDTEGALIYDTKQLEHAIVVINSTSNIDGRNLTNLTELCRDVHNMGGILIVDAAQTMAHYSIILKKTNADVICFSSHKMYGPSLGVVVATKRLIEQLKVNIIGGGTVSVVKDSSFTLLPDEPWTHLEPGLQDWAGIIGFRCALDWIKNFSLNGQNATEYISEQADYLFSSLSEVNGLNIVNNHPSSVVSVYHKKFDAHKLALYLSAANVMCRSGYLCCHYYLIEQKSMPPVLRFSIGLQTNKHDIDVAVTTLRNIVEKG